MNMNPKPVVLMVDDEQALAPIVEFRLDPISAQVLPACTDRQAMEILLQQSPVCVLMDGELVAGKGIDQALRLVRSMLAMKPETYIIAHSSKPESNEALVAAGCRAAVWKGAANPNYPDDLLQAVVSAMHPDEDEVLA